MQFSLNSAVFAKALARVVPVAQESPITPVLECVFIRVGNGEVKMKCSSFAVTVAVSIAIAATESASMCLPAKQLLNTVQALPSAPITCTYDTATRAFTMESGTSKYRVVGWPPADFPRPTETTGNGIALTARASELHWAIESAIGCASKDELRPALTAVLFDATEGVVNLAAADGHRLLRYAPSSEWQTEGTWRKLVSRQAAYHLLPLLKAQKNERVTLQFDATHVRCLGLAARLIDEKYPDIASVIPAAFTGELLTDKTEWRTALRRLKAFTPEDGGTAKMLVVELVEGGPARLRADDVQRGSGGEEVVAADFTGLPLTVGLNIAYLTELLNLWPEGQIRGRFNGPSQGAFFSHAELNDGMTVLLMPMQTSV